MLELVLILPVSHYVNLDFSYKYLGLGKFKATIIATGFQNQVFQRQLFAQEFVGGIIVNL